MLQKFGFWHIDSDILQIQMPGYLKKQTNTKWFTVLLKTMVMDFDSYNLLLLLFSTMFCVNQYI